MQNRRIFITGVTAGLGRSLVQEFLAHGYEVWGIGRSAMDDAVPAGGKFVYTTADVTRAEDVDRIMRAMNASHFIPDIVLLNAGVALDDVEASFRFPAFKKSVETNLFGAITWIESFLPAFLERGGTFAAVSSLSAYRAMNRHKIGYPCSKAALNMAFEGMRIQYGGKGVRFVTFCPGPMRSEGNSLFAISYQAAAKRIFLHLHQRRRANVVRFPLVPSLLYRVSSLIPDRVLARLLADLPAKSGGSKT